MAADWALVGRDRELRDAIAAIEGQSQHCVLAGEAGVGKSRLVRALAAHLSDTRAVVWVTATRAARAVPFGAVAHLLPEDATSTGDRLHLLQTAMSRLRDERRAGGRVLLVVDDAHLLDDASAAFVLQAATSGAANVALTIRAGEPTPDSITTLWKDGLGTRLDVEPLDEPSCRALLESAVSGPVDRRSAERVWQVTAGNPLFVRELVLSAQRSGALAEIEGVHVWRGRLRADERLHDMVTASLGELDPSMHDLLGLLAAGERIPLPVVDRLVDSKVLARAERHGLVEVDTETDHVRFAHPIYGEVLGAQVPPSELRAHRRVLVAALASEPPATPSETLRRALMQMDAGVPTDSTMLLTATEEAVRLAEYDVGRRLARADLPEDDQLTAHDVPMGLLLVRCLIGLGRGEEAADLAARFVPIAPELDGVTASMLAIEHNRALFWDLTDVPGSLEVLDQWLDQISDPVGHAIVASERAGNLALVGRFDEAMAAAEPLIAATNDVRIRLRAFGAASIVWMARGRHREVMNLADELLVPALSLQDELPDVFFWVGGQRILAMMFAGELDAAEQVLDNVEHLMADRPDEPRAMLVLARGLIQSARGRPRSAVKLLRESLALCASGGINWRLSWVGSVLAEAAALAGDTPLAVEALEIARDNLRPNVAGTASLVWRATAWTEFAQHGSTAGREAATRAADHARAEGVHWMEALCLLDALHFGGGREIASRLEHVTRPLEGTVAPAYGQLGLGLRTNDPDVLLAAAEQFAALGHLLNAAACAHWAAERFRRSGRMADATTATTLAAGWAGKCEGARAPVLVAAARAEPAAALTRREREIVLLAAGERSNREIAAMLSVSVRTVEGHLARSYAKLGITKRTDLADLGFAGTAGIA